MTAPLLEIRDLGVRFRAAGGWEQVLDGVDMTVYPGQTVGILGESGVGKTLTALAILQLLPPGAMIHRGSLMWKGENLRTASANRMRAIRGQHIAMIFQDSLDALNPIFSVGRQIVEAICVHGGIRAHAARRRALELMAQAGLEQPQAVFSRFPHQLSGGMRQRVMAAMALANQPALLIADEPTTAMDLPLRETVLQWLRHEQQVRQMAIILISHQLEVLAEYAERVMVLYGGTTVETAPAARLFSGPLHPYTAGLISAHSPHKVGFREPLPILLGWDNMHSAGCRFAPRCSWAEARCWQMKPPLWTVSPDHRVGCWKVIKENQGGESAAGTGLAP